MSVSLSRLQSFYGELDAKALLRVMINQEFSGQIASLTSFGADAALLLAFIAEVAPATPILFLDTKKHFPETLEYARKLEKELGLTDVRWLEPDPKLVANIDADETLWSTQPNRCCWMRKVEPLHRAFDEMGITALITGRKRYQTPERANMNTIELDGESMFRINPFAYWTREEIDAEIVRRNLPAHPLVAKGYKSIGCAPCTLPVEEGQDERAGRWAHTIGLEDEQKAECGIHVPGAVTDWTV